MWSDIDVVSLGLCWLRHVAGLVEELWKRGVGEVVGEGASMRNWDVDLDGSVEARCESFGIVSMLQ